MISTSDISVRFAQALPRISQSPKFRQAQATRPTGDSFVRFGASTSTPLPPRLNLVEILAMLGNDKDGVAKDKTGIKVSKHFVDADQPTSITYGKLYDSIRAMAHGYRELGLGAGSKIAMAETNTLDFFSSYFGGLAIEATMVPINLLALQDSATKAQRLAHMLSTPMIGGNNDPVDAFVLGEDANDHKEGKAIVEETPGVDAFGFGADRELFASMYDLQNVLKLKKSTLLRKLMGPMIERVVVGKPAEGLKRLFYNKYNPLYRVLSKKAATEEKKENLNTFFNALPAKMKLITPEQKVRLTSTGKMLHPSQMQTRPAPDQVADILYTSGTSGNPKGVSLTHRNLTATVQTLTHATQGIIGQDDVILMGLPLFHIFGKAVMLTALSRQLELAKEGKSLQTVMLPSLSQAIKNLDKVVQTIADYKITTLPAVPVFLEKLLDYVEDKPEEKAKLASLKTVVSGGDKLKEKTFNDLKALNPDMNIIEGYGSSEAGVVFINTSGVYGYLGMPIAGVDVKIVPSLNDPNEGELLVKSEATSKRYVKGTVDGEKGASTSLLDDKGYYHTGDIVRYVPEYGYKMVGRNSFFIKIAGEKRSPEEIEQAIRLAVPAVNDAMTVPHDAGTEQERAVSVVVTEDPTVTEDSIKAAMGKLVAEGTLAGWKIPRHIIVLNQRRMPVRFDNGFKRDAGYKIIRQFLEQALALKGTDGTPAVVFHNKDSRQPGHTDVNDKEALQTLIDSYNQG